MAEEKKTLKQELVANIPPPIPEPLFKLFPPKINLKMDNEFYLEVDLVDFFDRVRLQGYTCVVQKKIPK